MWIHFLGERIEDACNSCMNLETCKYKHAYTFVGRGMLHKVCDHKWILSTCKLRKKYPNVMHKRAATQTRFRDVVSSCNCFSWRNTLGEICLAQKRTMGANVCHSRHCHWKLYENWVFDIVVKKRSPIQWAIIDISDVTRYCVGQTEPNGISILLHMRRYVTIKSYWEVSGECFLTECMNSIHWKFKLITTCIAVSYVAIIEISIWVFMCITTRACWSQNWSYQGLWY